MATILNPSGLLAYGDNDSTVIWRSPLTSLASITTPDIGGQQTFNAVGTGQLFDPVKGLLPGPAGYYWLTNINNNADLNFGGQVTFQVATAMLACASATSEGSSGGTAQTTSETLIGMSDATFTNSNYIWNVSITNKSLALAAGYGSNVTQNGVYISDVIGKGAYTTLEVAWNCNTFYLYVEGVLVITLNKPVNFPTYYSLYLGNYPLWWVGAVFQPLTTSYLRNVQVSSRRPAFSVHPVLALGQVFGDSYADDTTIIQASAYDVSKYSAMTAEFYKNGLSFGGWNVQSYGGRKVIGSGNAALYLIDNVPTAIAAGPTVVVFQGGANDLTQTGTLDQTAFANGMHAIIEKFMGVNGNPATTVQRMVINSTPWAPHYTSDAFSLARQPDITSIQSIQAGIPAWWDATYPTLAGRVKYFDMLSQFGGFSPDPSYFAAADLLHPGPKGRYVMGKGWAQGLLQVMR